MEYAVHEIEPVWDKNSRILILGSFPSVKSREGKFFYHHPQNRFWKVMAAVLGVPVPETVEEKKTHAFGPSCGGLGCDRFLSDRRFQRQQYSGRGAKRS